MVLLSAFNFSALPSLAALAVLVAVFRSILGREQTEQLNLWLTGWVLVLVHFVAQFADVGEGRRHELAQLVSLNTLELAGIAFLVSVAFAPRDRKQQFLLALTVGLPALAFTDAVLLGVTSPVVYCLFLVIAWGGGMLLIWGFHRRAAGLAALLTIVYSGVIAAMVWAVVVARPDVGIYIILSAIYGFVGLFYWRSRERVSTGVLTTTIGFLAWGAVFPTGLLHDLYAPSLHIDPEVWNIPKYFVAVGMILTLLEEQLSRNEHLAHHDALTGLPNRRLLTDRFEQALANATRVGTKVAVLVLDLDTFKQVNDSLGHRMGDLLLKSVVDRLSSRVRASDTLARSGGDEFTVISDVADSTGAEVLAKSLVHVLRKPFEIDGQLLETGVSIGVALFPDNGKDPDDLRAAADYAMYDAKRSGRNCYAFYTGVHTTQV